MKSPTALCLAIMGNTIITNCTSYKMYNTRNPIGDWHRDNEIVRNAIETLSNSGLTIEQQAEQFFEDVSVKLGLPKYPADIEAKHYERSGSVGQAETRSVFEELAILNYLEPEDDPRGKVALALYHLFYGYSASLEECAIKHYGSKRRVPNEYMVCFIGKSIYGSLHFLKEGESWFELEALSAIKIIK